jgi:hypothetical protein
MLLLFNFVIMSHALLETGGGEKKKIIKEGERRKR